MKSACSLSTIYTHHSHLSLIRSDRQGLVSSLPSERTLSNDHRTHDDYVKCLAHSPSSAWVASAGLDRRILLWDTVESRPNPLVRFSENTVGTSIYSLAATPTGQLLAAGSPHRLSDLYDPRLMLSGGQASRPHCQCAIHPPLRRCRSSALGLERCDRQDVGRTHPTLSSHLLSHSTSVWALHKPTS
ncbi:hypothetical protein PGT21_001332 [Puccinia graminis f. sp. tritici]|uniref:Uncharacterized protein n=1 Tax=Puccinia graminis f. sp. tritici TaxID=56615 RepID=A0A5B0MTG9_PUCGR|nr:hypothetical protein PGT21_001332 [Puccinia graminis f. sp. tritici]